MSKKQETVLTEVADKIGSALGIIAAEAAKAVRPLGAKRARRSPVRSKNRSKKRTTASARPMRRSQGNRKRTRRSM